MTARIEQIVGRYIHLNISGREHRVYFEEAGTGIPLLCLHTAGADGRQWRALLNDPEVTARFRVIAYDMPWHGKSSPPEGWQDEDYALTSAAYIEQILAVSEALELDRPVAMGCSIGGRIILYLAYRHPEKFRALIGLQSSGHVDPYYDTSWLARPDVGSEVNAASVSGLIAPMSPDKERWETLWHYMQGGPGIFKGDLHFYKKDGDIRGQLGEIDIGACPIHLLTGEYDYSCPPADTEEVAQILGGSPATIMEKIGHFPMSENPELFMRHLRPILDSIAHPVQSQGAPR